MKKRQNRLCSSSTNIGDFIECDIQEESSCRRQELNSTPKLKPIVQLNTEAEVYRVIETHSDEIKDIWNVKRKDYVS